MAKKEIKDQETRRKNFSFLMLVFPTFLLALIPDDVNGNALYALALKVVILGFQYFVAKFFVESFYN